MDNGPDGDNGEIFEFDDIHFEGPVLDVPAPPRDLPYAAHADYRSDQLLLANGIALTDDSLIDALVSRTDVLLAAAAHACGSHGVRAAIPRLTDLAGDVDDNAAVEAAHALVRLGQADARAVLRAALQRPPGPYLSPVVAAGYLAQLGDASGYAVVRDALANDLFAVRMLGCKQLAFLWPHHGSVDGSPKGIDVLELFSRALRDPERSVQEQALVQLRALRDPATRPLLEQYLASVEDSGQRQLAREAVDHLPG